MPPPLTPPTAHPNNTQPEDLKLDSAKAMLDRLGNVSETEDEGAGLSWECVGHAHPPFRLLHAPLFTHIPSHSPHLPPPP